MSNPFRSLFLALPEEEHAVFADVFPLLITSPTAMEEAARAAAGGPSTRSSPVGTSSAGEQTPPLLHSPSGRGPLRESRRRQASRATAGLNSSTSCGRPARSLLFAIGTGGADALLVVLRTGHVVLYGLSRSDTPPSELYRFCPLPTTLSLAQCRKMDQLHPNRKAALPTVAEDATERKKCAQHRLGAGTSEATCAVLLPLHISYCCRVVLAANGPGKPPRPGSSTVLHETNESDDVLYLRGIVGNSDGRVSVFSDTAYALSFAAHETPVTQVDAVLLPPCVMDGDLATAAGCSVPLPPRPSQPSSSLPPQARLQRATQRLGIVTCCDERVFLWRRLGEVMSSIVVVRPSFFCRHVAYTIHHPSSLSALLSAHAPASQLEAAIDAEVSCPSSSLLHMTGSMSHVLRVRQLSSLRSRSASASAHAHPPGRQQPRDSIEDAAPTWRTTCVPGPWWSRVTAIATHHNVTLVAMGTTLLSFLHFHASHATRLWTAKDPISRLVLSDAVALAVCGSSGTICVLTMHPSTGQALRRHMFYSYANRSICHVSLHEASLLMTVVDVCGSTELVQLPSDDSLRSDLQPIVGHCTSGVAAQVDLLASMVALRTKISIEELRGSNSSPVGAADGAATNTMGSTSTVYHTNTALDQLHERLLLARLALPEGCDRYLEGDSRIL